MTEPNTPPYPARPPRSNLFANVETGVLSRVKRVDEAYAYIEVVPVGKGALGSSWSMPVAQYDTLFAPRHQIVAAGHGADLSEMRLPVNAPIDWYEPETAVEICPRCGGSTSGPTEGACAEGHVLPDTVSAEEHALTGA